MDLNDFNRLETDLGLLAKEIDEKFTAKNNEQPPPPEIDFDHILGGPVLDSCKYIQLTNTDRDRVAVMLLPLAAACERLHSKVASLLVDAPPSKHFLSWYLESLKLVTSYFFILILLEPCDLNLAKCPKDLLLNLAAPLKILTAAPDASSAILKALSISPCPFDVTSDPEIVREIVRSQCDLVLRAQYFNGALRQLLKASHSQGFSEDIVKLRNGLLNQEFLFKALRASASFVRAEVEGKIGSVEIGIPGASSIVLALNKSLFVSKDIQEVTGTERAEWLRFVIEKDEDFVVSMVECLEKVARLEENAESPEAQALFGKNFQRRLHELENIADFCRHLADLLYIVGTTLLLQGGALRYLARPVVQSRIFTACESLYRTTPELRNRSQYGSEELYAQAVRIRASHLGIIINTLALSSSASTYVRIEDLIEDSTWDRHMTLSCLNSTALMAQALRIYFETSWPWSNPNNELDSPIDPAGTYFAVGVSLRALAMGERMLYNANVKLPENSTSLYTSTSTKVYTDTAEEARLPTLLRVLTCLAELACVLPTASVVHSAPYCGLPAKYQGFGLLALFISRAMYTITRECTKYVIDWEDKNGPQGLGTWHAMVAAAHAGLKAAVALNTVPLVEWLPEPFIPGVMYPDDTDPERRAADVLYGCLDVSLLVAAVVPSVAPQRKGEYNLDYRPHQPPPSDSQRLKEAAGVLLHSAHVILSIPEKPLSFGGLWMSTQIVGELSLGHRSNLEPALLPIDKGMMQIVRVYDGFAVAMDKFEETKASEKSKKERRQRVETLHEMLKNVEAGGNVLTDDQAFARLDILATLPCSYLGCASLPAPGGSRLKTSRCGACQQTRYCSPACQKKDWKEMQHKNLCQLVSAAINPRK